MTEQMTVKAGRLARSLAGRDKGVWYVVIRADETGIYVADGRLHAVKKPKRKNPKHLQPCGQDVFSLLQDLTPAPQTEVCALRDEQIRYALRRFEGRVAERQKELEGKHVEG